MYSIRGCTWQLQYLLDVYAVSCPNFDRYSPEVRKTVLNRPKLAHYSGKSWPKFWRSSGKRTTTSEVCTLFGHTTSANWANLGRSWENGAKSPEVCTLFGHTTSDNWANFGRSWENGAEAPEVWTLFGRIMPEVWANFGPVIHSAGCTGHLLQPLLLTMLFSALIKRSNTFTVYNIGQFSSHMGCCNGLNVWYTFGRHYAFRTPLAVFRR